MQTYLKYQIHFIVNCGMLNTTLKLIKRKNEQVKSFLYIQICIIRTVVIYANYLKIILIMTWS